MAYFRISHLACGQANIHSGARYQCVGSTLPQFVPYRGITQRDPVYFAPFWAARPTNGRAVSSATCSTIAGVTDTKIALLWRYFSSF